MNPESTSSATIAAYTKIKVPDFTGMLKGAIFNAVKDTWASFSWKDSPYFYPAIIGVGVILAVLILLWVYVNIIR